jgi:hypothetical protein
MRFDERTSLSGYRGHVLVLCPRCAACAHLRWLSAHHERRGDREVRLAGHRLTCGSCGHTADWLREFSWQAPPVIGPGPRLDGFGLDVWLQVPCSGEVLWAYNEAHLRFLEEYVGADLRERWPDTNEGWQDLGGLGRKLPKWMLSAKNREAVLRGLAAMRERLPGERA